jgi:hypothetical protein
LLSEISTFLRVFGFLPFSSASQQLSWLTRSHIRQLPPLGVYHQRGQLLLPLQLEHIPAASQCTECSAPLRISDLKLHVRLESHSEIDRSAVPWQLAKSWTDRQTASRRPLSLSSIRSHPPISVDCGSLHTASKYEHTMTHWQLHCFVYPYSLPPRQYDTPSTLLPVPASLRPLAVPHAWGEDCKLSLFLDLPTRDRVGERDGGGDGDGEEVVGELRVGRRWDGGVEDIR